MLHPLLGTLHKIDSWKRQVSVCFIGRLLGMVPMNSWPQNTSFRDCITTKLYLNEALQICRVLSLLDNCLNRLLNLLEGLLINAG